MSGSLSGIRVLDLSRILAGPWAGQLLADLGADVIKIERPGHGDDTRLWGAPYLQNDGGGDTSETAYYLCTNRGKKSITLNIASARGSAIVQEMAKHSDVVIENYKTGNLARYGLAYQDLKAINPNIIYCSITGFGQSGPMRGVAGYDFILQALGGLMSITGEPDEAPGGGPKKVGIPVADLMTGMYATVAILAALMRRERNGGGGEYIDMGLLDCQVAMLSNQAQNYLVSGKVPQRYGNAHPNVVPYQAFETTDGHIILAIGNDGQFKKFCEAAGLEHLISDTRFSTCAARVVHRDELIPHIAVELALRSTEDWCKLLQPLGVPCGPINDIQDVFQHQQVQHRQMKLNMKHPQAGTVPLVANPIKYLENPIQYGSAPPLLGQHTDEILSTLLSISSDEIASLRRSGVV